MVLVRRIRKRGATIVVEAHGEVLMMPGADISRWTNRFSNRVTAATAAAAPSNKRPRWSHYGESLKRSFTSSTVPRTVLTQGGRGARIYSAVGSRTNYAAYVDQGTGIYAGRAPWRAKILPPWTRGGPSLYEHTWIPPGSSSRVRPVMIKGQRGQGFFEEGLKRGFQSMRMRSFQVPGDPRVTEALRSIPSGLLPIQGPRTTSGFIAQLEKWRAWRDEAWRGNRDLRNGIFKSPGQRRRLAAARARTQADRAIRKERRARLSAERSRRYREKNKTERTQKPVRKLLSRAQDKKRVEGLANKRFGSANVESINRRGDKWEVVVFNPKTRTYSSYTIKARSR